MKRQLGMVGLLLLLATPAPAQQQVKDFFQDLQNKTDAMRAWDKKEMARLAEEWKREVEQIRPFWLMLEADVLQSENHFAEAAAKAERSAGELEKKGNKRTPAETVAYRETLLSAGRARAAMGDQEQACAWARRAWKIHERLPSASRPASPADRMDTARTALAAALVLLAGEQPGEAAPLVQRVFDECRALPEPLRQPERNPFLAEARLLKSILANSEGNFRAARDEGEQTVALFRLHYPKKTHPEGEPKLALALVNLATAHVALGELVAARPLLDDADGILKRHAPKGEPIRAEIQRLLGHLHLQRQEVGPALAKIQEARAIHEKIFPESKYPRSHPVLIQALLSLADLLNQYGQHEQALRHAEAAEEKCRKRYPKPHEQYVAALLASGRCLRDAGKLADAKRRFARALDAASELDRQKPTSASGLRLALVQLHLGSLMGRMGRSREAEQLLRQAEATYRKLSPEGHPHWFAAAGYRGIIALQGGDRTSAREAFASALDLDQRQLRQLARTATEVEVLTFARPRQLVLHGYLSATRGEQNFDEAAFQHAWQSKYAATRLAQARRAALRIASDKNPETQQLAARMVEVCTRLRSEQLNARGSTTADLLKEMDRLERELSRFWPDAEKQLENADGGPRALASHLPKGSAFLDFVRYDEFSDRRKVQSNYAAFVVLPGQAARRVELNEAEPIDRAIRDWRKSVEAWNPLAPGAGREWEKESDSHAATLRRRVWEPLAALLPADTKLLLLAPDGDLARFPFAALPGPQPRTILLEDYCIAYVPHGSFLLEQLNRNQDKPDRQNRFLVVGGVDYGPVTAEAKFAYPSLPGTRAAIELAKQRAATREVTILSERRATVEQLLRALPDASEAHLATHFFFDEAACNAERERITRLFREWTPRLETPLHAVGLGQRFPLSYVGIALAGANDPKTAGLGGGVLNGEAIPPLSLAGLRWVALDGCETGLGEHTAGEGVEALTRAFHLAGCPNVVATLWRVYDDAARTLMDEFYRQLWDNHLSAPVALRQAQLALFHNPGKVRFRSASRGAPTARPSGELDLRLPPSSGQTDRSHAQMWGAAYVHSGIGSPFVDPAQLAEQLAHLQNDEATPTAPDRSTDVPSAERAALVGWGLALAAALSALGMLLLWHKRRRHQTEPRP